MTVRMLGPAEVRDLAELLDVQPTKKLGQNFVHDANTVRRIVTIAGVQPGESVLEVGPGLGSLTLGLLDAGAHVTAVEIDKRLGVQLPVTVSELAPGVAMGSEASVGPSLDVIVDDAMRITELPREPDVLVANLP